MFVKRFAVSLLMFLALYACASAQRSDVAFVAGSTFSNGVTGQSVCEAIPVCPPTSAQLLIDQGFTFEGSYAYRLADFKVASVHMELPVIFSPARRANTSLFGRDFSTVFFTPSVKLKLLPKAGVSPFLTAGAGFAHFGQDSTSDTTGAFQVGGGLDFKTHLPVLGFRLEVRDLITGRPGIPSFTSVSSDHMQNFFVGGGITLHF